MHRFMRLRRNQHLLHGQQHEAHDGLGSRVRPVRPRRSPCRARTTSPFPSVDRVPGKTQIDGARFWNPGYVDWREANARRTSFRPESLSTGGDITPGRWLEFLQERPIGPYPGTTELLLELRQAVAIGCLSNTNVSHKEDQSALRPVLEIFDRRPLSFELRLRKQGIAIYQADADRLRYNPDGSSSWTISARMSMRLALSDPVNRPIQGLSRSTIDP
jgi:hypothetical protein